MPFEDRSVEPSLPGELGFPHSLVGKESTCNAGDLVLVPGLGRSPGDGKGYPLWYSGQENSMDCIVPGVAKSGTQLSDFHCQFSLFQRNQERSDFEIGVAGTGWH